MSETAISPREKARNKAYKEMKPALREIADSFDAKLRLGAKGIVVVQYNMGSHLAEVLDNEAKYGAGAAQQLADYLVIPGGTATVYGLRQFAGAFKKDFVQLWCDKPLAGGGFLELSHWLQLARLEERKDQEKWLDVIVKKGLSANDLSKELKANRAKSKNARSGGGRKPKTPTSAIAGLQATFGVAQKLNNYEETAEKKIFAAIEEMPPEQITEALKTQLEKTIEALGNSEETSHTLKELGESCLERVETVLKERAEEEGEEEEEEEKKPRGRKAKAKAGSKVSSNGEDEEGKKGKKKKKVKVKVTARAREDEEEEEDED